MSFENLTLGQLIKTAVEKEIFKMEFSRGIAAPGKIVSSYERHLLSDTDKDLKEVYDEIGRRESDYRRHHIL